jgi:hypothetical protein
VVNTPFPSGCTQPAGTPHGTGTITVNNVPAGAKVWVNIHLDYAPKGDNISTVIPNPMTKMVRYGPFSSRIEIKSGSTVVGTSYSETSVIGRGKKVTMAYGVAKDSLGNPLSNRWVRITQGTKSATYLTGADGFYVFFDSQVCDETDGLSGGCFTGSTPAATWAFAGGSTTLAILGPATLDGDGEPIAPVWNASPAWPGGSWACVKVVSGSTTFATITYPNAPTYTFSVSKGASYPRDWKFIAPPGP